MLALLGLLTVVVLLAAIMSKRVSPLVALILVPTVAAIAGGFGADTGTFIVRGIRDIAPVAGMFVFAILYFGIVTDAVCSTPSSTESFAWSGFARGGSSLERHCSRWWFTWTGPGWSPSW